MSENDSSIYRRITADGAAQFLRQRLLGETLGCSFGRLGVLGFTIARVVGAREQREAVRAGIVSGFAAQFSEGIFSNPGTPGEEAAARVVTRVQLGRYMATALTHAIEATRQRDFLDRISW